MIIFDICQRLESLCFIFKLRFVQCLFTWPEHVLMNKIITFLAGVAMPYPRCPGSDHVSGHLGFLVKNVALRRIFSANFCFACQFLYYSCSTFINQRTSDAVASILSTSLSNQLKMTLVPNIDDGDDNVNVDDDDE
jgi:hypothetical protein